MQRTCAHCQTPISRTKPTGPLPTYCGQLCRRAVNDARYRNSDAYGQRQAARQAAYVPTAYEMTCATCCKPMVAKRKDAKYCSAQCMEQGNVRRCGEPECERPHRAKGLCVTHYNQHLQTPEQRHAKVVVPCTQCGTPCVKDKGRDKRYGGMFCSYPCREAWKVANGHVPSAETIAKMHAALQTPWARALRRLRKAARGTKGTTWVAGRCQRCARPFVSPLLNDIGRYCSDACKRRQSSSRRRARKRGAAHIPYVRADIFERDGYRCHLCKKMTLRTEVVPHPRAPVIDHLIPLGPGDDAGYNVATACFLCNSRRRDVGPAQLLLFG